MYKYKTNLNVGWFGNFRLHKEPPGVFEWPILGHSKLLVQIFNYFFNASMGANQLDSSLWANTLDRVAVVTAQ